MVGNIRNFVIIAHIDHGKSTLADRFLEITGTIDKREMKPQYLDQLELERERGITIKMAPVRMIWRMPNNAETLNKSKIQNSKQEFVLNLIDTPGHADFSYEVSRALAAVEGAVLLVDASQGIQAQTLVNFRAAEKTGLKIIGAVNKIDLFHNEPEIIEKNVKDLAELLSINENEIFRISGKTGEGVEQLLTAITKFIPPPKPSTSNSTRALVFDSFYDEHKGVIAFVRVFSAGGGSPPDGRAGAHGGNGEFRGKEESQLIAAKEKFKIKEVGYFYPQLKKGERLSAGEIGYIATGIKNPDKLKIGDTIGNEALPGYREPKPVVFVSLYPDEVDEYDNLKQALNKLKLNDASLSFESDFNEVLGRGFKCGFLGQLHFEITAERLEKEFKIKTISTFPLVAYKVRHCAEADQSESAYVVIKNVDDLPPDFEEIWEPTINLSIIAPAEYLGSILQIKEIFRLRDIATHTLENRILITARAPLSALISDFDGELKSVSRGMASFSYELGDYEKADLEKVQILIAGEAVPGLTRLMYKDEIESESRKMLLKLKEVLPKQQFSQALQAEAHGRIVARENIPAMRKDVTGYLYGGDRTRKMKLWKKQKRGKEKLQKMGRVSLGANVFKELLKK